MNTLDIFTFFDTNTLPMAECMYDNIQSQLSRDFDTSLKAIAIDPITTSTRWDIVATIDRLVAKPSRTHATALQLIPELSMSDYVLITDADIAFLTKSFDKLLIDQLVENCVVVGAHRNKRYSPRFPGLICSMFDGAVLRKLPIDFFPGIEQDSTTPTGENPPTLEKITKSTSGLYGLKPGSYLLKDTGYKLRGIFQSNNYGFKELKRFPERKSNWLSVHCLDDIPLFSHMGSCRFAIDENYSKWLAIVNTYTNTYSAVGMGGK